MADPLVFLNGRFLPQAQAHLTLHDAGFVLGATVADLCRTFNHRLYRWPDHLARFRDGTDLAAIHLPIPDDDLTAFAEELVRHNATLLAPGRELALVVFATPGPIGYYLGEPGGPGDGPITLGMHTFPLPCERYRHLFLHGGSLAVPEVRHVSPACIDPRIKQRSRLHWWLADRAVRSSDPGSMALLADEAGYLTETMAANFLIVKDGVVVTPPSDTVLPGVSLKVLRELCLARGISWQERPLTLAECQNADEAMLTGTAFCLAGVSRLQRQALTWPGPLYRQLLGDWSSQVGVDIAGQFMV